MNFRSTPWILNLAAFLQLLSLLGETRVREQAVETTFSNSLLGANTVSRWESGRNVQTAAMDMLLRLIRDLPGSIEYLRARAA